MKRIVFTLAALSLFANAFADVQVKVKDGFGSNSTFSSNGRLVRVDGEKMEGFIIVDFSSGEFFMVDLNRNEVMRTSLGQMRASNSVAPIDISLKDRGSGQKIAGYLTRKYEMIADGELCGSVYTSSKLLQNKDIRAIFESMRNMQQFSSRMMGGMSEIIPLCQRASMQTADVIESSGAPLRTVDKSGKLISEVVSVDTDKKYADDHYKLPVGMAVVDMSEQMNQAAQQSQQMMENMPDMDELIKQMQQNDGQMSEEMQQQMQQMMEQLQQMQQ
jgi:hypothetical protein